MDSPFPHYREMTQALAESAMRRFQVLTEGGVFTEVTAVSPLAAYQTLRNATGRTMDIPCLIFDGAKGMRPLHWPAMMELLTTIVSAKNSLTGSFKGCARVNNITLSSLSTGRANLWED